MRARGVNLSWEPPFPLRWHLCNPIVPEHFPTCNSQRWTFPPVNSLLIKDPFAGLYLSRPFWGNAQVMTLMWWGFKVWECVIGRYILAILGYWVSKGGVLSSVKVWRKRFLEVRLYRVWRFGFGGLVISGDNRKNVFWTFPFQKLTGFFC